MTNEDFLKIIKADIDRDGYHLTFVNGGQNPDFSYSIGLTEKFGFELIVAGGGDMSIKGNERLFDHIIKRLQSGDSVDSDFFLSDLDTFSLNKVDPSWCKKLMLGVYDYYELNKITAYQIISKERTMDMPLMSKSIMPYDPIWKWLDMDWNIAAPKNSYVITDLGSLKGNPIIELTRWEDHVWEMFSLPGPDVEEKDIRIVPLGTILGIDTTLEAAVALDVGQGLWRENKDKSWEIW